MRATLAIRLRRQHLHRFCRRVWHAFGIWLVALSLAPGSALGEDDDPGGPPNPVPAITLEQCIGACYGIPFDNPKGTCQALISLNLFNFKDNYEVSAPTAHMGCALDQTETYIKSIIDTPYKNPFADVWFSDNVDFQIYLIESKGYRIDREGYRIPDHTPGHPYTGLMINEQLAILHQMNKARSNLIERFNGLQAGFRNDLPWPKLVNVAPKIWPIAACVAMNDERKRASKRAYAAFAKTVTAYILDPKLAPFAFYKDWYDLTSHGTSSNSSSDNKCGARYDSIVTPFYAQKSADVQIIKNNLLGTLYTTENLTKRLLDFGSSLDKAERHLQQARFSFARDFATKLAATYVVALSQFNAAATAYAKLRQDHDIYKSYSSKKKELMASIAQTETSIQQAGNSFAHNGADFAKAQVATEAAAAAAAQAYATVDKARIAIGAVTIHCAGRVYKDCGDEVAKATFDKALYQANSTLNDAIAASLKADGELKKAESAEEVLGEALFQSRKVLSELRRNRIDISHAVAKLDSQNTKFDASQLAQLRNQFARLQANLGHLRVIAAENSVDLGPDVRPIDLSSPKRIFGLTSCEADDFWVVFTNGSGTRVGPVHLTQLPNSPEVNYAPLSFEGDGVRPGGNRNDLTTKRGTIEVVALHGDNYVVGHTRFPGAFKGSFYELPLPGNTTLPYRWPANVQYAKYNLVTAVVDGEVVWVLEIRCS